MELPSGWEGSIDGDGPTPQTDGPVRPTVAHFSNFPLPAGRDDFGGGAVEEMVSGDVFVVLFEYAGGAGRPLFAAEGMPRLAAGDFDRNALQTGLPGQTGVQRFFTAAGRAFCLYVVVGSHIDRADVIPQVNQLLAAVEVT